MTSIPRSRGFQSTGGVCKGQKKNTPNPLLSPYVIRPDGLQIARGACTRRNKSTPKSLLSRYYYGHVAFQSPEEIARGHAQGAINIPLKMGTKEITNSLFPRSYGQQITGRVLKGAKLKHTKVIVSAFNYNHVACRVPEMFAWDPIKIN